jgi:hypothetical protein
LLSAYLAERRNYEKRFSTIIEQGSATAISKTEIPMSPFWPFFQQ